MFALLQAKAGQLDSRPSLREAIQKLEDQADTKKSAFGFLFKSQPAAGHTTVGYQNSAFSVAGMLASNTCRQRSPDKPFSFLDSLSEPGLDSKPEAKPNFFRRLSPQKAPPAATTRAASPSADLIDWRRLGRDACSYRPPCFWEDLDPLGQAAKPVSHLGFITFERERDFVAKVAEADVNCWKGRQETLDQAYFRQAIDLMLMGVEGEVFAIDAATGTFSHRNFNRGVEQLSGSRR